MSARCLARPVRDLITRTVFGSDYKLWRCVRSFCELFVTSSLTRPCMIYRPTRGFVTAHLLEGLLDIYKDWSLIRVFSSPEIVNTVQSLVSFKTMKCVSLQFKKNASAKCLQNGALASNFRNCTYIRMFNSKSVINSEAFTFVNTKPKYHINWYRSHPET